MASFTERGTAVLLISWDVNPKWINSLNFWSPNPSKAFLMEYFIKNDFEGLGLQKFKEFIHFGLTSQDINNTAVPLSVKEAMNEVYVPQYLELLNKLEQLASEWADVPMLARTHGQPASPTRLGKEIAVFVVRLKEQFNL